MFFVERRKRRDRLFRRSGHHQPTKAAERPQVVSDEKGPGLQVVLRASEESGSANSERNLGWDMRGKNTGRGDGD